MLSRKGRLMIDACIFDLDSCLSAANEVGDELFEPAFNAVKNANQGAVSDADLDAAFAACWRHPLDWVATKYGFTDQMRRAAFEILKETQVLQPMFGYGDLPALKELEMPLFLVTSGFRKLQESKVRALGLDEIMTAIYIDAIDEPDRVYKKGLFERILRDHGLAAERVLAVGDNPDSEIAAGNSLGMRTAQILRPGVPRGDNADYYIARLDELKPILAAQE